MQVEIDFEVFKALTAKRQSEADSYNDVIRRLLELPPLEPECEGSANQNAIVKAMSGQSPEPRPTLRDMFLGSQGAWFGNAHFPEGTHFRATYKGKTYHAEIKDGVWLGEDGVKRTSPSEAAGAISGTNVNGWRFWYGLRPQDEDWRRLDEFRK